MAGRIIAFWLMGLIGSIALALFMGWMVWGYHRRLEAIESAKPHLVLTQARGWQYHTEGATSYYALQGWFRNEPRVPSESSVASHVTAMIVFYDHSGNREFSMHGCWTQPDIIESADILEAKDLRDDVGLLLPNDTPHKLLIAVKWPGDEIAYGLSRSSFQKAQFLREAGKELKKGNHYAEVLFKGVNVEQEPFWFSLVNPGQGGVLTICQLKAPPDFDKAASRI